MSDNPDIAALTDELTALYAEKIPAAHHMQAKLSDYNSEFLTLSAPLSVNHNDHGNAFGGSLYNLAVLSGWTALYLECRKHINNPHIVTRDAQIRFRHPVTEDVIEAVCRLPNQRQWDGFFAHFEKSGQTTISLSSTIQSGGEIAARLETLYVLLSE